MNRAEVLMDIVINGLRDLATSLETAAAKIPLDAEVDEPAPMPKEEPPTLKPTVTLDQVRAVLADKSLAGFTEQIRGLLEKHGAQKLSQIDPANYAALLADAEALK